MATLEDQIGETFRKSRYGIVHHVILKDVGRSRVKLEDTQSGAVFRVPTSRFNKLYTPVDTKVSP